MGINMKTIEKSKLGAWYSSEEFEALYTYPEGNLGAEWTRDKTTFRVWAPTAEEVYVNLYSNGLISEKEPIERIAMRPYQNGVWTVIKNGDLHGTFYTYSVLVDGE